MKLFISYRRKSWPFAQRLVEQLGRLIDAQIFIDIKSVDESNFERSILRNLSESDAVLLIVSEYTFDRQRIRSDNDWVRREIAEALQQKKPIVLARIDGIDLPPRSELPRDIQGIHSQQAISFYAEYFEAAVQKLADFIVRVTPITATVPTVQSTPIVGTENFVKAMHYLEEQEFAKAQELLQLLQSQQFTSEYIKIDEMLELLAQLSEAEGAKNHTSKREYAIIAALSANRYTIKLARVAWEKFRKQYPDFQDDTAQLEQRLKLPPPEHVTFLELFEADTIEQVHILQHWTRSQEPEYADWLNVPIGITMGNQPRRLSLSTRADGVHGIIAGATGSGKSELLQTIILGLAVNYDPSVVNFVLVDYKGGAAFDLFADLPHCVDILTNLDTRATERTFTALNAEIKRRSRLLSEAGVKDIVEYRQKGYHKHQSLPFLLIIIDEFAEMIQQATSFRNELDSVTRLGRALGISLILATQRPAGVITDQMRANIKFRICLRVENAEDSRELLHQSDAAFLPVNIPGRGYLQVGNSSIELLQIAHTGEAYTEISEMDETSVRWLETLDDEVPIQTFATALIHYMTRLAEKHPKRVGRSRRPWPGFLPETLYLDSPFTTEFVEPNNVLLTLKSARTGQYLLAPILEEWIDAKRTTWESTDWQRGICVNVGIIDNPYNASQLVFELSLVRGHIAVFSAPGWGKSTFLRTILLATAANHSPADVNVYVLNLTRGFEIFSDLPHIGGIIALDEEERITRLMRRLLSLIDERKTVLSMASEPDYLSYNANNPYRVLPAILVFIDTWSDLVESYEDLSDSLLFVLRNGRACGIHLIVANISAIPGKFHNLFQQRITFKQNDVNLISEVLNTRGIELPSVVGRGLVQVEREVLEFQAALPIHITLSDQELGINEFRKIDMVGKRMTQVWKGIHPPVIGELPNFVDLRALINEYQVTAQAPNIVIGVDDLMLDAAEIQFKQRSHFVIVGPPNSGKSTALRSCAMALAALYPPEVVKLVLVDFSPSLFYTYGGLLSIADLPHVTRVISNEEEIGTLVDYLKEEYERNDPYVQRKDLFILIDNYDDLMEVFDRSKHGIDSTLASMARRYASQGLHFLVTASLNVRRYSSELFRRISESRYGFALQDSDAVDFLGGRILHKMRSRELSPGRGYLVRSGHSYMTQIATPRVDNNVAQALDQWIDELQRRHD